MFEPPLFAFSALVGKLHSFRPGNPVHNILIYKLDQLGDILLATPSLRALRKHYPDAHIKIVVGEWGKAILANNPNINDIVVYNSPRFTRSPQTSHHLRDLKQKLGSWKPDLVIGLRDDWRTITDSIFSRAGRIERGRVHIKEWIEVRRDNRSPMHELERMWETIRPLGVRKEPAELDYFISNKERQEAQVWMREAGIASPFVVLHPGTSHVFKEWALERFAEVARFLQSNFNFNIVAIGSPEESGRSSELVQLTRELNPVDVSGQKGLRLTAALLEHASLYIGSDGGMMHIASALGIPTIGLFGPGSYPIYYPTGKRSRGVSRNFPCSPCYMTKCVRPTATCMQAITVEEVIRETISLMAVEQSGKP